MLQAHPSQTRSADLAEEGGAAFTNVEISSACSFSQRPMQSNMGSVVHDWPDDQAQCVVYHRYGRRPTSVAWLGARRHAAGALTIGGSTGTQPTLSPVLSLSGTM
jgi:hypothetical protein